MTDQRIAPPLGLLYIAAVLKRAGHEVEVSHLNPPTMDDADIYGVSVASTQIAHAIERVRFLKDDRPDALVVIGGPHVTTLPNEALESTGADIAVVGEGEMAMLDIADGFRDRVVWRPHVPDLDTLPYPARELLDWSDYTRTIAGAPATNIITARGCPARCVFCDQDVWGNKLRMHSAEYVLGEVDDIREKTGITRLLFLDDTLTANRDRILAIAKGLKERGVIWRGWTRANCIDAELAAEMKSCGCHSLCIGIESGSDRILRNLRKGTTVEMNRRAIAAIKSSGMLARVSVMVGSPGETPETIEDTKRFLLEVKPDDWITSTFVPVVGSPAWKEPEKHGLRLTSDDYTEYFVVGYDERSGSVCDIGTMTPEEVESARRQLIDWLKVNVPRKPEEVVR